MKKFPLLCCLLILAACSKNEVIPPPDNLSSHAPSVAVSHLDNDDLTLVDGLIQLKISKEEAVNRGVPASEYDLVEGTIARHNETKGPLTKSVSRQMLAWGILEYPSTQYHSNSVSGLRVDAVGTGSIILYYTILYNGIGSRWLQHFRLLNIWRIFSPELGIWLRASRW